MGLEIKTTPTQIGIDRQSMRLTIQSQKARLEIHQNQAKINIHTELPRVLIDQYECFASAGLKNSTDLAKEISGRTNQQVLEYIGQTARDGYQLAAIENDGNPIASIAKRDSTTIHEFGLDFLPKVGPKIAVTGTINIDSETNSAGINNGVEGNYIPGNININYTPTQINIFLKQYGSIDTRYQSNAIDTYI